MKKAKIIRNILASNATDNMVGHPAFKQTIEEQAYQIIMTGIIGNTYYMSQEGQVGAAVDIAKNIVNLNPEYTARLIKYGRQKGFMRHMPLIFTAALSAHPNKSYIESVFNDVIGTPKDVSDYIDFCKSGVFRKGIGTKNKELINSWLGEKMSEYWALKYRNELTKIIKLTHPKMESGPVDWLFNNANLEHLPQIRAYEQLEYDPVGMVLEGKLPHEIVTGSVKMTKEIWEALLIDMPAFATLRNLNAMIKAGVDSRLLCNKLESFTAERIKNSKIMPMYVYKAYQNVTDNRVKEQVGKILEQCLDNVPKLEGKGLILLDISGSMTTRIKQKDISYAEVAALITGAIDKTNDTDILMFDTGVRMIGKHPMILGFCDFMRTVHGGGTDCGIGIKHITTTRKRYDWIIGLTDTEEWHTTRGGYMNSSRGLDPEMFDYRRIVNPDVKFIGIRIDPYVQSKPLNDELSYQVCGYSDAIFSLLDYIINDKGDINGIMES